MFTGLITRVGKMDALTRAGQGYGMSIAHPGWDEPLVPGESISVMGVCLTVVRIPDAGHFSVDVLDETLARTSLGGKSPGSRLNLERALRPMDRLGGHFVTGHVDGTGSIQSIRDAGRDKVFRITCSEALTREMVIKGSIACDGISLTLAAVEAEAFEVHIIPHTIENTALEELGVGALVNLETDILGKYILKASPQAVGSRITLKTLTDAGYT